MTEKIPKKETLNKITHAVRASQSVLQYGVGAMVDFPDQTLMTAAPEYWSEKVVQIHDERFEKALNVSYFGMPGGKDLEEFKEGISYVRFPEWYFCPKCRKFQPLSQWYKEYRQKCKKALEYDPYMVKSLRCMTCRADLVVARIVVACESGHISDFPWIKWVHRKNISGAKDVCANPSLTFKTGASASEGLEGLVIKCQNCKATATLRDAFDPEIFKELDNKSGHEEFRCEGKHPHKNLKEKCVNYPRTLQRGTSSVYFPVTLSSLVIPPYAEKLTEKIEKSSSFKRHIDIIHYEEPEGRIDKIKKLIGRWANEIAVEIGVEEKQVEDILHRKWLEDDDIVFDTTSIKYRAQEYDALSGSVSVPEKNFGDFSREAMDVKLYDIPHLKSMTLINKIREVRALVGFTRVKPTASSNGFGDPNFVCVKKDETNWYPGYEVRGEGLFFEFDENAISKWLFDNPEVFDRIAYLNKNYGSSFLGQNNPRIVSPEFVMLHTLAHLLIKQLSFECGYSIASLRERIYCGELEDGKEMTGIFIYTASGDAEGTLGGLVRQGRPDAFGKIFKKALGGAKTCSNDPVCILSRGQGRDSLNLAACHACTLIPETSCEEFNAFLDRGIVVGTFANPKLGFFMS